MSRVHANLMACNRGEVSRHALARVDLERLRLSAEEQVNFLPFALGPMTLRPGLQYVGATDTNQAARILPFIFSNSDTALIELTDLSARIWLSDVVLTRPSVATAVSNGGFGSANFSQITIGTTIGDLTGSGGLAAAKDGTTNQAQAASATKAATADAYVGGNFSAAPKRFHSATVYGSNNSGFVASINPNVTIQIYGKTGGAPASSSDGTVIGTTGAFADTANESAGRAITSTDVTTLWDYIWARVTHDGAANIVAVAELVLNQPLWQLVASAGCTADISGGKLTLTATARGGVVTAIQQVTVAAPDQNIEHAFRIIVDRGPVIFKAGLTSGAADLIAKTTLDTGEHSLACTPTGGSIYLYFESTETRSIIIDTITVEAAGVVELPTPWTTALLPLVRVEQSGDIIFGACYGKQQRKIERRATRSWSVVKYESLDGPFKAVAGGHYKMTPGAMYGNTTLTSERPHFTSSHVGALFRLFSTGQTRQAVIGAADVYTDAIRVAGVGNDRAFDWIRSGTWVGTVTLQRSVDGPDSGFVTLNGQSVTTNGTTSFQDSLDNVIAWYRAGFKAGAYTSGSATITFSYSGGGDAGVCRVTALSSSTSVSVEVLDDFTSLAATYDWLEGEWSDEGTWPSCVRNHDGRLWWAGGDKLWGSHSDSYYSFSTAEEGDAVAINRSVGFGPIDIINDLVSVARLIALREGSELSVRSSSLDEPITPTNFTLKDCSTQGSARLPGAKVDTNVIFISKSGRKVYELTFQADRLDYAPHDLTRLNLEIGDDQFVDVAVSRQPDTYVHLPRGDGRMAELLYEREDEVEAWWRIEPADTLAGDCLIENVAVLPGTLEDTVYCVVKRTIGGATKRYIEKFARRDQCLGQPEARLCDSHIYYSGAAVTTITGLSHLEGETVAVWGWNTSTPFTATLPDGTVQTVGVDLATFTVTGGQITGLALAVTNACVGLAYEARFESAKLAYGGIMGTAINQKKRVDSLGVVLLDTHCRGLRYGSDADHLDYLPLTEDGFTVDTNTVWATYDKPEFSMNGAWDTDSRIYLKAASPRPATVAGITFALTTNESP